MMKQIENFVDTGLKNVHRWSKSLPGAQSAGQAFLWDFLVIRRGYSFPLTPAPVP